MAKALTSSSIVPAAYQGNIPNALIAMEVASRIGCSVLMVMQNLDVIHGNPSFRSKFLIATVNTCGRFSPLRYRFEGEPGTDEWGCRCVATDLESGDELVGPLVSIGMAKAEKWYQKSGSKWQTMPELMLQYRSAAFWSRVYAPELSMGMHTTDEVVDAGLGTPPPSPAAADLGEALRGLAEGQEEDEGPDVEIVTDDEPSPATDAQKDQLKSLREKAREAGVITSEDEESIEKALRARKDGSAVVEWIQELNGALIEAAQAQGSLLDEEG